MFRHGPSVLRVWLVSWRVGREFDGDALVGFAAALGVFVALEPAVDAGLRRVAALHVEDDFGAGVGFAAVVDQLVEVFAGFHLGFLRRS